MYTYIHIYLLYIYCVCVCMCVRAYVCVCHDNISEHLNILEIGLSHSRGNNKTYYIVFIIVLLDKWSMNLGLCTNNAYLQ